MESTARTIRHNPLLPASARAFDQASEQRRNTAAPKTRPPRLHSSLNCHRIALKCLKVRPNSLSDDLVMIATDALLTWIDERLDNPIKTVESGYVRTVTVFDCIHYVRDAYDSSFRGYISYEKPRPSIRYTIVSLDSHLAMQRWILPVMHRAIPWQYMRPLRLQYEACLALAEEAARLVSRDPRFIALREQRLKDAIDLDPPLLAIVSRVYEGAEVSSDDLTVIWQNKAAYQQLIEENSRLIRFFHAAHKDHRRPSRKLSRSAVAEKNGEPKAQNTREFDLSSLRKVVLASGLGQRAWRYLHRYGDAIFRYVWQIKPNRFSRFQVAVRYLKFIAGHGYPPPPAPAIIRALLFMQGYDEGDGRHYASSWEALESRVISIALHYFGRIEHIEETHIDELLLVAYHDLDYGIELDSNQLKRGWPWIVERSRRWQESLIQKVQQENVRWRTRLGNIDTDGLRIREIGNLHDLFTTASLMRNCLANRDDDCIANQARFFTVEQPGMTRPVAVVGLVQQGSQWAVEDVRGFANSIVDERLQQIGRDIAARYNHLHSNRVKPPRRPTVRIADL